ncbi:GNAT family N-acetyltransferase [Streptomyces sp. 796.1]|uniref:GNAT family N-acetyltransferase n=1 Tax=Streptomyces sp. 796.1 TaxID=3163029 RepID=UPI0039C93AFF
MTTHQARTTPAPADRRTPAQPPGPDAAQPPAPERLTTTICRDPRHFAALAGAWDDLYRRCSAATPFQTHAWLHSWWLSYGHPHRLRLVLVHRNTPPDTDTPPAPTQDTPTERPLVAVAPLLLGYRPFPTLLPLGLDISDFCDVLIADDCPQAADALAAGLSRLARTALIDLREVRPGAAVETVVGRWRGPVRRRADSICLELPARPMDDLLRRLSGASARNARRKLRRVDALGVTHHAVPADQVPAAVATMLDLHRQQWQGRGVTPEHLRPRFAAHLARATRQLVRTGDAVLSEYRIGDDVLVSEVTLLSRQFAGGYLYGAHPEARRKIDIATMLLRQDATRATATGRSVLSLLRGDEPYKRHWRPRQVVNQRFLLGRRHLAPALWLRAGHLALRAALAETTRTRLPALRAWRTHLRNHRNHSAPTRP